LMVKHRREEFKAGSWIVTAGRASLSWDSYQATTSVVPRAAQNSCHSEPGRKPGEESAVCRSHHGRQVPMFRVLCETAGPERSRRVGFPHPIPL